MLDRLRERVEVFLEAAARDRCRFELEVRSDVQIGARYARAGTLFHQDHVREVQRALAGASGSEEKQLRFLLEFLADGHSRCVVAGELDRVHTWISHASVGIRDRTLEVRRIPAELRATADPALRAELAEARFSALDEQLPLLEGLAARQRDAVEELGYGTFVESCEFLSGVDLRALARESQRFLADTEGLHRELLAWYLPRLAGVEPPHAAEADGARLAEAAPYSESFADPALLSRVQEGLAEAGIDPTAQGRLRTASGGADLAGDRAALCCPLQVPDEVVLTVAERPGRPARAAALRELGFALQRAYTSPDLDVEFRRLGDRSVPIGCGRVVESLLCNPSFMARTGGIPRTQMADYLRLTALLDLLRIRRDAALLQVELAAFSELDVRDTAHRYAELLGEATGLRHDPRGAFWAILQPFRAAVQLRGDQWGAVLGNHLRGRFDVDWWRNPRTGGELRDLFHTGQSFTAGEMSVQLESRPLSFARVRESIEDRL